MLRDVRLRFSWLLLVLVALLAQLPPAAAPGADSLKPPDYTFTRGLSQVVYGPDQIIRDILDVPVPEPDEPDGQIALHVEVVRPNVAGRFPVILEASPYHGTLADRDGTRILPEPRDPEGRPLGLTGYFAPRGYAVVMVDLRGTGQSEGCLDHIGPKDTSDLKAIVEWAASQAWSNGRVGMTGHSYVGSTPSNAAASVPNGLVTIVPSAGLAHMYDHQFQAGVPYFLQWAGPMFAYEQLALERHLPGGDNELKDLTYAGCGLPNSSLVAGEAQLSGQYVAWHAARDWRAPATAAPIPIFMVHGVNDNAARVPAMQWFTDRQAYWAGRADRPADKIWLGQWDHGSGCCPTRRGIQWTYVLHAWFDKHLAQRRVDTGPPVEVFLADAPTLPAAIVGRTEIYTTTSWPGTPGMLRLFPSADGTLSEQAPAAGSVSFPGDARGFARPQSTGGATFTTAPVGEDLLLVGMPRLKLVASVTAPRVHLIANLYDQDPGGTWRRISQLAINPELRNGIETVELVLPGVPYTMDPPAFAMAHHLRAGHRLVLRVTTSDPDKVPTFAEDPNVTVFTGPEGTAVDVPLVEGATLYADTVRLTLTDPKKPKAGTPQPTLRTSVTPASPGLGERNELTTALYEFDVQSGFDNARLLAGAVPALEADIDLFLHQLQPDGTWQQIQAAESSRLTDEFLAFERPPAGRYRLEVHNWAGAPGTRVDVTVIFVNSAGEPGEGA
jgi:predicted acyl esterase